MDATRRAEIRAYSQHIREDLRVSDRAVQDLLPTLPKTNHEVVYPYERRAVATKGAQVPPWRDPSATPSPRNRRWKDFVGRNAVVHGTASSERELYPFTSESVVESSVPSRFASLRLAPPNSKNVHPNNLPTNSFREASPSHEDSNHLKIAVWARWLLCVLISQRARTRWMGTRFQAWRTSVRRHRRYRGRIQSLIDGRDNHRVSWVFQSWRLSNWRNHLVENVILPVTFRRFLSNEGTRFFFRIWVLQLRMAQSNTFDYSEREETSVKRNHTFKEKMLRNYIKRRSAEIARHILLEWVNITEQNRRCIKIKICNVCKFGENRTKDFQTKLLAVLASWPLISSLAFSIRLLAIRNRNRMARKLLQRAIRDMHMVARLANMLKGIISKKGLYRNLQKLSRAWTKWLLLHHKSRVSEKVNLRLIKVKRVEELPRVFTGWQITSLTRTIRKQLLQCIRKRIRRRDLLSAFLCWKDLVKASFNFTKLESTIVMKSSKVCLINSFISWSVLFHKLRATNKAIAKNQVQLLTKVWDRWALQTLSIRQLLMDKSILQCHQDSLRQDSVWHRWQIAVANSKMLRRFCSSMRGQAAIKWTRKIFLALHLLWVISSDIKSSERKISKKAYRTARIRVFCEWKIQSDRNRRSRRKALEMKSRLVLSTRIHRLHAWMHLVNCNSKLRIFIRNVREKATVRDVRRTLKAWKRTLLLRQEKSRLASKVKSRRRYCVTKNFCSKWKYETSRYSRLRATQMTIRSRLLHRSVSRGFCSWAGVLNMCNNVKECLYANKAAASLMERWRIATRLCRGLFKFVMKRKQHDQTARSWEVWHQWSIDRSGKKKLLSTRDKQIRTFKLQKKFGIWRITANGTVRSSSFVLESATKSLLEMHQTVLSKFCRCWKKISTFAVELRRLGTAVRLNHDKGRTRLRFWNWRDLCLYRAKLKQGVFALYRKSNQRNRVDAFEIWVRHAYLTRRFRRYSFLFASRKWNRVCSSRVRISTAVTCFSGWSMLVECRKDVEELRTKHSSSIFQHFGKRRLRTYVHHWNEMARMQKMFKAAPEMSRRKVDILAVWGCVDRGSLAAASNLHLQV